MIRRTAGEQIRRYNEKRESLLRANISLSALRTAREVMNRGDAWRMLNGVIVAREAADRTTPTAYRPNPLVLTENQIHGD